MRSAFSPRVFLIVLVVLGMLALPAAATDLEDGNLSIVKELDELSPAEIAVRLSETTFGESEAGTVIVGRQDEYADSMASSALQDQGPLLLVPSAGPLPDRVIAEVIRLGADRAILMGGDVALSEAVDVELRGLGLTTERRAGTSRIETAVDVAETDLADASTVLLSRGFGSNPDDPTQAWIDTIAAGALAVATGSPILLTQTEVLTASTSEYLARSGTQEVQLLGGTLAISPEVETELQALGMRTVRIAGEDRFGTATEIAKARDVESAADAARIVLVDGSDPEGWAGGFAAARLAGIEGGALILTNGPDLPPSTVAFAQGVAGAGGAFAQDAPTDPTPPQIICVTLPSACDEFRELAGLPAVPTFSYAPAVGSTVALGDPITVTASDPAAQVGDQVVVSGECVETVTLDLVDGAATFSPTVPTDRDGCVIDLVFDAATTGGTTFQDSVGYLIGDLLASFDVTTPTPAIGSPVSFADTSDGIITAWDWDFGDGATSTQQNPSHTFDAIGDYDVTLRVRSASGVSASTTQTVTVGPPLNNPPTAAFALPNLLHPGLTRTFANTSSDSDGTVVSRSWSVTNLDGGPPATPFVTTTQDLTYTFGEVATYRIALRVTDNDGAINTRTRTVEVTAAGQVSFAGGGSLFAGVTSNRLLVRDGFSVSLQVTQAAGLPTPSAYAWSNGEPTSTAFYSELSGPNPIPLFVDLTFDGPVSGISRVPFIMEPVNFIDDPVDPTLVDEPVTVTFTAQASADILAASTCTWTVNGPTTGGADDVSDPLPCDEGYPFDFDQTDDHDVIMDLSGPFGSVTVEQLIQIQSQIT